MNRLMTNITKNNSVRERITKFLIIGKIFNMMNVFICFMSTTLASIVKVFAALMTNFTFKTKNPCSKSTIFGGAPNCSIGNSNATFPIGIIIPTKSALFSLGKFLSMFYAKCASLHMPISGTRSDFISSHKIVNEGFATSKYRSYLFICSLVICVFLFQCFFSNDVFANTGLTNRNTETVQLLSQRLCIAVDKFGNITDTSLFRDIKLEEFSIAKFIESLFVTHNISNISFIETISQHENARKSEELLGYPNVKTRAISSRAIEGKGSMEGSETNWVSPNNNPIHEHPTRKGRYSPNNMDNILNDSLNGYQITSLVITNIDPVDTWFQSNIGSTKATQRTHEWMLDALAAPASNAQIEGNQVSATAIVAPTRTSNQCQILGKYFAITETEEIVEKAGRDSEVAYQKTNKLKELANDMEYALLINASTVTGAVGTARQMKGVIGWLTTNVMTGTATSVGSNEPLTEDVFNRALQLVWNTGGKPSNCLMGAFQKRKIDAFTTNVKNVNADENKLVNNVSIYESPFGTVALKIHHIMHTEAPDKLIIFGDMKLWKKAWMRPLKWKNLPYTGFAQFWGCEAELTLESRAETGSGIITELTTA